MIRSRAYILRVFALVYRTVRWYLLGHYLRLVALVPHQCRKIGGMRVTREPLCGGVPQLRLVAALVQLDSVVNFFVPLFRLF